MGGVLRRWGLFAGDRDWGAMFFWGAMFAGEVRNFYIIRCLFENFLWIIGFCYKFAVIFKVA